MAKQKTNKTAKKRMHISNPKGNRTPKLIYKQSHQSHLRTGKSSRAKRRQKDNALVNKSNKKRLVRKVVNL